MRGVTSTEVRNAARSLWRSPTVTFSAILCLALGIGATTAISSALSRALLQPLPFWDPERLVAVHRITPQSGPQGAWSQSVPNYIDLARETKQLEALTASTWGTAVINLPTEAIQVSQRLVTGNFFATLRATPQRGRFITPDDDRSEAPLVAVLSDELWRTKFGADPDLVGRSLTIAGEPTIIVGIAPVDFRVPVGRFMLRPDIHMPIRFTPAQLQSRRSNNLLTFGRLASGATVQSAQAELRGIFANLVAEHPQLKGDNVRVAPLHAENLQAVRKPLFLLFGAVCMVLLIAATNVAALLLARGVQRQREMAVRSALGASRWDMLRAVLLESFVLTAVAVVVGIGLASAGVKTIGLLAAARLPQLDGLRLDLGVLAFALTLSAIVAILCGLAPAWRATRVDPQDALRGGRGGGAGREHHRALRTLVVLEISLSLILLIGAGLVLKGFARLLANDPGFDSHRVLTLNVTTSANRYPNQTSVQNFLDPALAAIQSVPGVEAAATINAIPYVVWGNNSNIRYEGQPGDEPARLPIVEQRQVSPGFFEVTRQRLISGRLLRPNDDDGPSAGQVVVVNEALVKRDFQGQDPVGKRFHRSDTTFATIVGVVSNIRNYGPITEPQPEMYSTVGQRSPGLSVFSLMVRVKGGDPTAIASGVRAAIRGVDPSAAVAKVTRMDDIIAESLGSPRFYFSLLGSFAAIAIVLAVAGLYGVLSYAVAQRTREIGIRSALGSSRAALMRLIAMEGFRLVAAGVMVGLVGGAAVTRLMEFMLYGISPLDVTTWALAALLMMTAAMAAAVIPARRAAKVDPLVAMQME